MPKLDESMVQGVLEVVDAQHRFWTIVNLSLTSGQFHPLLKESVIYGVVSMAVSYTHLTLPTNREV